MNFVVSELPFDHSQIGVLQPAKTKSNTLINTVTPFLRQDVHALSD